MTIYAACALVFNKTNEVLCVSRKHRPDDLGLPGGKIILGETPEMAFKRELYEETGVIANEFYKLYEGVDPFNLKVCITYYVHSFEGEPKQMEPGIFVSWQPFEALLQPHCTFASYNKLLFEYVSGTM